jgi:LPXTG-site transpeptidase (sortase) family protein
MPGEPGNAVLNGHTSSKRDGVFDKLHKLERGDTAQTTSKMGTCDWRVRANYELPPAWFTPEHMKKLYRMDGKPGLVFITCSKFLRYGRDGHAIYRKRTVTMLSFQGCV